MKKLSLFIFFHSIVCFGQNKYPQDYFRSPLEIPIFLSGTFGELRSNHFHSGLDIKTQGKEGLKVFAAADGYVSRIKVSQYGFGKALYITHPNGYTTVYAHLSKYTNNIEKYVKSIQYKKENYATGNIYLREDKFPVKKGEIIALSGDTGGSGGPHLHYEIRSSKTEKVINPMFFGLLPKDNIRPTFRSLMAYTLDDNSRINNSNINTSLPIRNMGKGFYKTNRISANGTIGFGVDVIDKLNGVPNKNGIFSLEMLVNDKRVYYHDVETFAFSESKLINLLIDYKHYKNYKRKLQKTHKVTRNTLSIYEDLKNNGKINIKEGFNYTIKIIAKDFKGNKSIVQIPVVGAKANAVFSKTKDTTNYKIVAKKFQKFKLKNVTVAFPKNTFYEDVYLDLKIENDVVKIHKPTIPLDKSYTLTFNVANLSENQKQQSYIANVEYPKYPRYQFTRKKDTTFYTTTKYLGNYKILKDSIKPKIRPLYFKNEQWISNATTLKVKISDVGSGIKSYGATIDGKWILMEYNHKKGILTYNFSDKKLVGSKHIFKLVVSDNVSNTNSISRTFYRK